jgi:hypothetical protein
MEALGIVNRCRIRLANRDSCFCGGRLSKVENEWDLWSKRNKVFPPAVGPKSRCQAARGRGRDARFEAGGSKTLKYSGIVCRVDIHSLQSLAMDKGAHPDGCTWWLLVGTQGGGQSSHSTRQGCLGRLTRGTSAFFAARDERTRGTRQAIPGTSRRREGR